MDMNDAGRIIAVVDKRIEKKTGVPVETTWGEVCEVSADGKYASAYLYGDEEPSRNFRLPGSLAVAVGDKVKVAWNSRGERWVFDVVADTEYRKIEIDLNAGEIRTGDGTVPATPLSLDVAAVDVPITDSHGHFTATDVEEALDELAEEDQILDAAIGQVATDLTGHEVDATGAHAASAISVADGDGIFDGTDVEEVLFEIAQIVGRKVRKSSTQSITTSTWTKITSYDVHDIVGLGHTWNPYSGGEIRVDVPGVYLVTVASYWGNHATGQRIVGATFGASATPGSTPDNLHRANFAPNASINGWVIYTGVHLLAANATVAAAVFQSSGTSLNLNELEMSVIRLGVTSP